MITKIMVEVGKGEGVLPKVPDDNDEAGGWKKKSFIVQYHNHGN